MTQPTTRLVGSTEYVSVTVTADVPLTDAMPVDLTLDDGATWLDCIWLGSEGTTRRARTLAPVTHSTPGYVRVVVRVTDTPEVPLIPAGYLEVSG